MAWEMAMVPTGSFDRLQSDVSTMRIWSVLRFAFSAGTVLGCGRPAELPGEIGVSLSDSAGVSLVTNPAGVPGSTWTVSPEPAVKVDGRDPALLLNSVVSAGQLRDGRLIVLNANPVRIFLLDRTGKLVRQFGRRGGGPGEYRTPEYLSIGTGDTITVWDTDFGPGYSFDTLGRVVGEFHTDLERLLGTLGPERPSESRVPLPGIGILAMVGQRGKATAERHPTWATSWGTKSYAIVDTSYRILPVGTYTNSVLAVRDRAGGRSDVVWPYIFHYSHALASGSPLHLFLTDAREYRIDERDEGGRLLRSIRKAGSPRRIDDTLFARMVVEVPRKYSQLSAEDLRQAWKVLPDQHLYPAILGIVVDALGNLWVRESMTQWSVFSPKGVIIANAQVPLFKVFEIGERYILGLSVDADGIESVLSLPLKRQ
jgi:hypothetical protein